MSQSSSMYSSFLLLVIILLFTKTQTYVGSFCTSTPPTSKSSSLSSSASIIRTRLLSFPLLHAHQTEEEEEQSFIYEEIATTTTEQHEHHLGLPQMLHQLDCGDEIVGFRKVENTNNNNNNNFDDDDGLTTTKTTTNNVDVTFKRISISPPIYRIQNFVTCQECDKIMELSTSQSIWEAGQTESGTMEDKIRKKSFVTWLGMNNNNSNGGSSSVILQLANAIRNMMLPNNKNIDNNNNKNDLALACEPMQVVRYDREGEYKLHHDGNNRILTVLYYINGVGETWFPLAESKSNPSPSKIRRRPPQTRQEALDCTNGLIPGRDGILVTTSSSSSASSSLSATSSSSSSAVVHVQRGDAIAFYSYLQDGSMDWRAIHSGMPAREEKFIANHFIRYIPTYHQKEMNEEKKVNHK